MSPATTTTLGKQAREALQRVRREIRAAEEQFEKRLKELREEEARVQAVIETLRGEAPAAGSARQTGSRRSTRTRRSASSRRSNASKSNGAGSKAASARAASHAQAKGSQAKSSSAPSQGVPASERHEKILQLLSKSELTREELAEALGVTKVRVGQLMQELVKQKKVVSRQDPRAPRPRKLFRAAGAKQTVKA